jgi:uroporphyrinogen-III synthase
MNRELENLTIAVTEHRYGAEFARLFERYGAKVVLCPLVEEAPVDNREEIQSFIRLAVSGSLDMMIFLTGVGARFLLSESEQMGLRDQFLAALRSLTVVARGPKPQAALHREGVNVDISAPTPTSEGVVDALRALDLRGRKVGVQLYGAPNPYLCSELEKQGAEVHAISIYTYGAPSAHEAVAALIEEVIAGNIAVVTFTSAPQVRFLFETARTLGRSDQLAAALNDGTIAASIGPVTDRALQAHGVTARIAPSEPKMGPMANAVAEFFRKRVQ